MCHRAFRSQTYRRAFLGNRSLAWVREAVTNSTPFFLYLAPHSPHGTALPAPWYEDLPINATAPRPPSWNYSATDHHWLIEQQKPLSTGEAAAMDTHFQKRWRCLRMVHVFRQKFTLEDAIGSHA
jgi:N-acetylglucosamine-6-sulfatase